jgi:hypothetical protein
LAGQLHWRGTPGIDQRIAHARHGDLREERFKSRISAAFLVVVYPSATSKGANAAARQQTQSMIHPEKPSPPGRSFAFWSVCLLWKNRSACGANSPG